MSYKIDRKTYAQTYGPTPGDRVRLADTQLFIFSAALLAERRLSRGLKLNYPETIAFLSFQVLEWDRDGKSVSQLM